MYKMNDKSAAIRTIPNCLNSIKDNDSNIVDNGVYNDKIQKQIIDFQSDTGIKATGIVDYETFQKLYEKYFEKHKMNFIEENLGQRFISEIKFGAYNKHVAIYNDMLNTVLKHYGIYHRARESMHFSNDTLENERSVQKIFGLNYDVPKTEFLYRLISELKIIRKNPKTFYQTE